MSDQSDHTSDKVPYYEDDQTTDRYIDDDQRTHPFLEDDQTTVVTGVGIRDDEYPESALGESDASSWVCAYCGEGAHDSVCQCVECGRYFCNGKSQLRASHAVLHLAYSRHQSIRLHPNNDLGGGDLECYLCGAKNIFNLGFIHSNEEMAVLLVCREPCQFSTELQELNWDSQSWLPLIQEKQFYSWILNNKSMYSIKLSAIKALERQWGGKGGQNVDVEDKNAEPLPLVFSDNWHYEHSFVPLLKIEEEVCKERGSRIFEHIPGHVERGANKKNFLTIDMPISDDKPFAITAHVRIKVDGFDDEEHDGIVVEQRVGSDGGYQVIIELELGESVSTLFGKATQFTLEAIFNETPFERMREVFKIFSNQRSISAYLYFSILGDVENANAAYRRPQVEVPTNMKFTLNESQRFAVTRALTQSLTLIQGPPGTGKTSTSVAIVYYLFKAHKAQILVCAPSNVATDHLAERISATGLNVVRVEAVSREAISSSIEHLTLRYRTIKKIEEMPERSTLRRLHRLKELTGYLSGVDNKLYSQLLKQLKSQIISEAEVVCSTCITVGSPMFGDTRFKYVLVDEATQAVEPEMLLALCRGAKQVVLVGDQCQMSSVVLSQLASSLGLGRSLFERLLILGTHRPFRLDVQYRMHPSIAAFPSQYFYEGTLQNGVTALERDSSKKFPWPQPEKPLFFYNSVRPEEMSANGQSYLNRAEAALAEQIVTMLVRDGGVDPATIGIITPYQGQMRYMTTYLLRNGPLDSETYEKVEIASVDSFQGREKEFIILSCVRSNDQQGIGFVKDWKRLNVSLTRAKQGLFIIGNARILSSHPLWYALLHAMQQQSLLVDGPLNNLAPARVVLQVPKKKGDNEHMDHYKRAVGAAESIPHHADPTAVVVNNNEEGGQPATIESDLGDQMYQMGISF